MTGWQDLPREIRRLILRNLCDSLAFDYQNYQSRFRTGNPFEIVWQHTYPLPLVSYVNVLLTCREFRNIVTEEITTSLDQSISLTLQTIQYQKVVRYSDEIFAEGSNDYREIVLAQSMFGCFWKNPFVCNQYAIFDDIFGGMEYTGKLVLVCLLEGVMEKCKNEISRNEYIKVQKAEADGSFHGLVFSRGSYYVDGDCFCFNTVSSWDFATFRDHDSEEDHGFYDSDEEARIELAPRGQWPQDLPDISASDPDSWWLGRDIGADDDWKQWYLVNYKEKAIFVGPAGLTTEWPDYFDLEELHLWQQSFLEGDF